MTVYIIGRRYPSDSADRIQGFIFRNEESRAALEKPEQRDFLIRVEADIDPGTNTQERRHIPVRVEADG